MVWTYVAYMDSGEDCGVWGTRTDTPDSLQNIKADSRRAEFDERCEIDRARDIVINKRMASAFFETNLRRCSPSTASTRWWSPAARPRAACAPPWSTACRAAIRTIVPEECVADKHESPHFANLYDMALKYADVLPVAEVLAFMEQYQPAN